MELYGIALSPYVARVLMCIRHKGLAIPLAPPPGGHIKSPEYLEINPYGKMPTLNADGAYIIESEVICEFLEECFPKPAMLPSDPVDRARCRTIGRAIDLYVLPPMLGLLGQMNPATRDDRAIDRIRGDLKKGLDGLEPFLRGPFAIGPAMTLADCALLPTLFYVQKFVPSFGVSDPLALYPAMAAIWAHAKAQPMLATLLEDMDTALKGFMARAAS